ncbi:MAG: phosphoribosylamine--glycine ligase [Candidatus Buchananbacteria bacterium CG10_big_fil_rev_8_21_14_0_10_42_9]|uniref:Phosphoribosylamine--glycine ligase n=1 Tax=Candidatus Buchananbacteria bacterium CG10_big_fil_rev_8_21_14_0_10_42_9 TaxID=1974526 RepID=A0A2H0W147_9BACT|nr:MAG: phosphoribosylamine--glycine ligase [Candidatus Buchananbacteria bacterium CG10_big_fil_rev_8_21_14_0_10_42_9]
MTKVLVVGSGAREHAIAWLLKSSQTEVELVCFASNHNPGLVELTTDLKLGQMDDVLAVTDFAKQHQVDFAVIGPELPLSVGVVEALAESGIPAVGPTQALAQIESSKSFTRDLLSEFEIEANPKYKEFTEFSEVEAWVKDNAASGFVIKPDGLTGGKGVKVQGDHFDTLEEGLKIVKNVIDSEGKVVVEEKLVGQEFSLMSFSDGENLLHMPPVQDHKRAFDGDKGPNTGGMGSYSYPNNLPFLSDDDILQAQKINGQVVSALKKKLGEAYKGILYGNYIAVKDGLRLIEYNARLGDPEAMNALSLIEGDFVKLCQDIINGSLDKSDINFKAEATVCKYIVPKGYPDNPVKNEKIDVSEVDQSKVKLFYAAVDAREDGLYLTGSRAIGVVATANTVSEAEKIVESEIKKITGPVFHRQDIGTKKLIDKRINIMKEIRG